jgi:hypothetical protein
MSNTPFIPFGKDAPSFINSNLAGKYLDSASTPILRYGLGGAVAQPDNSGYLPGRTTTLGASPEQPAARVTPPAAPGTPGEVGPQTDLDKLLDYLSKKEDRQREYEREDLETIRQMSREANRMGQWNTIMGSVLKDLPRALSEGARRRNMYIGDMLQAQKDAAREQSVGIQQALASAPLNPPARNYIRI